MIGPSLPRVLRGISPRFCASTGSPRAPSRRCLGSASFKLRDARRLPAPNPCRGPEQRGVPPRAVRAAFRVGPGPRNRLVRRSLRPDRAWSRRQGPRRQGRPRLLRRQRVREGRNRRRGARRPLRRNLPQRRAYSLRARNHPRRGSQRLRRQQRVPRRDRGGANRPRAVRRPLRRNRQSRRVRNRRQCHRTRPGSRRLHRRRVLSRDKERASEVRGVRRPRRFDLRSHTRWLRHPRRCCHRQLPDWAPRPPGTRSSRWRPREIATSSAQRVLGALVALVASALDSGQPLEQNHRADGVHW